MSDAEFRLQLLEAWYLAEIWNTPQQRKPVPRWLIWSTWIFSFIVYLLTAGVLVYWILT